MVVRGGTGATFQELEDGVGLPLFTALPIVSSMLEKVWHKKQG